MPIFHQDTKIALELRAATLSSRLFCKELRSAPNRCNRSTEKAERPVSRPPDKVARSQAHRCWPWKAAATDPRTSAPSGPRQAGPEHGSKPRLQRVAPLPHPPSAGQRWDAGARLVGRSAPHPPHTPPRRCHPRTSTTSDPGSSACTALGRTRRRSPPTGRRRWPSGRWRTRRWRRTTTHLRARHGRRALPRRRRRRPMGTWSARRGRRRGSARPSSPTRRAATRAATWWRACGDGKRRRPTMAGTSTACSCSRCPRWSCTWSTGTRPSRCRGSMWRTGWHHCRERQRPAPRIVGDCLSFRLPCSMFSHLFLVVLFLILSS